MALLSVGAQYQNAGNPNGIVAGQLGDQCKDTTVSGALYICVSAGTTVTTVWQLIGGGGGITYTALNNTIVIDNTARTIGGNYLAGTGIIISGNYISVSGGTGLISSNLLNQVLIAGNSTPSVNTGFSQVSIFGQNSATFLSSSSKNVTLFGSNVGLSLTNQQGNVSIGEFSMNSATTSQSVAVGINALYNDATTNNVALGYNAGLKVAAGSGNNTFVGYSCGSNNLTFNNSTFIGANADATIPGLSNSGAFGYNASISSSNSINLGSNCKVGINNPLPVTALDIANVNNFAVLGLRPSTSVPSPANYVGQTYVNSSDNGLHYVSTDGINDINLMRGSFIACAYGLTPSVLNANPPTALLLSGTGNIFVKNLVIYVRTTITKSGAGGVAIGPLPVSPSTTLINTQFGSSANPGLYDLPIISLALETFILAGAGNNNINSSYTLTNNPIYVFNPSANITAGLIDVWIEYTYY